MFKKFLSHFDQSQKIIFFTAFLFLAGASYLFSIDARYNDPKYNQDWFALSFSQPQSDRFDFVIENFSSQSDFQWELLTEKEKLADGVATIAPTGKEEISINTDFPATGRITIRVSSPTETREIYKHIN